jgi:hypothetical protein
MIHAFVCKEVIRNADPASILIVLGFQQWILSIGDEALRDYLKRAICGKTCQLSAALPISARDMTASERRYYERQTAP